MHAFFNGFFSVFLPPIIPPGDIPDWDGEGDDLGTEATEETFEPPSLASAWRKVGKHLRTAMSDYEYHTRQQ